MEQNYQCRSNWYAIHVRPRSEFVTGISLRNKGFELFVPHYKSKRRWSDRRVDLELPLFPGYIFCRFDVRLRLAIITTPGVVRIVGTSKMLWPISIDEIEAVKRVVDLGCKLEPHPFVTLGSQVCIEEGPLAGLKGIVKGEKNRHLILSIALVQQSISVEVENWAIRVIGLPQSEPIPLKAPRAVPANRIRQKGLKNRELS